MSMVIPDAAPEVKRRALFYVLCFFLAFLIFSVTVALYLARRKRSRRFNKRIYIPTDNRSVLQSAPTTPVRSSISQRSSLHDSLSSNRLSTILASPVKTPKRPLNVKKCSKLQLLALLLAAPPRWTEDSYSFDSRDEPSLFFG
ncbi:hypothetical protein BDZ89DRAFT_1131270 [Hymenopellis radicata]|nr:hypothetical protein BDZ89DRAFT_1131270 [Hymenopellis radicata]